MAFRHSMQPRKDPREFKIAIICALSLEAGMIENILDTDWEEEGYTYQKAAGDPNTYTLGTIAGKNVVLAYCSTTGSNVAAQVAVALRSSFTGIKIAFVVGVCGAVPYYAGQEEIVLGDCIMSTAVVQFDFGRRGPKGFGRKDGLDGLARVGIELGSRLAKLRTQKHGALLKQDLENHLQALQRKDPKGTVRPGSEADRLYQPSYVHNHRSSSESCEKCNMMVGICGQSCEELHCQDDYLVQRQRSTGNTDSNLAPAIHFGTFGSSNTVLKCGEERDKIAQTNNIIAFEMEASGVWDVFPTVIIKGVSDYADSHKTKRWQPYAAAVAAAGLKAFLQRLPLPDDTELTTGITKGSRFSDSPLAISAIDDLEAHPAYSEMYHYPQIHHNEFPSEAMSSRNMWHAAYSRGLHPRTQDTRTTQNMDFHRISANAHSLKAAFNICIDTLEQLETYKTVDTTSTQLQLFLRVKNVRKKLHEWAFVVGIEGSVPINGYHHELQNDEVCRVIKTVLSLMSESFTNMDHFSSKSLGTIIQGDDTRPDSRKASSADNFGNAPNSTISTKLTLILADQHAFLGAVKQLEDFAGKLFSLAPPVQLDTMEKSSMAVSDFSLELLTMDKQLQDLLHERQNSARTEVRRRIDQSLNPPRLQDELPKYTNDRLASTCDWIFLNSTYCQWSSRQPNPMKAKFLWLYGPAGFGKTILCSHITKYFQKTHSSHAYYHFSRLHAQSGGVPEDIIRVWILQIAESDDYSLNLVGSCLDRKASGRILHSLDVWSIFTQIVLRLGRCVFILDGLDEYYGPDTDLREFLRRIKESLHMSLSMFVLTSRDIPDIRSQMIPKAEALDGPYLFSHEITKIDTQPDINLFARSVVDKKLATKDSALKGNLASRMANRCDGMFLWVAVTGSDLRGHQSKSRLVEAVERAPDLGKAYERNWKHILDQSNDGNPQGLRILKWCIFSVRPLTVYELTVALAIQSLGQQDELSSDDLPDSLSDEYIDSEIREPCGSLVEVKSTNDADSSAQKIVQLTHVSVKEYLLSHRLNSSEHSPIEESRCHLELAKVCLLYLCSTNPPMAQENGNKFYEYATENWLKHKKLSKLDDISFDYLLVKFFNTNNDNFNGWATTFEEKNWTEEIAYADNGAPGPLYLATLLGSETALKMLLKQDASSINNIGGAFGTALQAACAEGHESAVAILLDSGADVKVKAGVLGSALGTSAHYGRYKLVIDLLERGAEIDEQGNGTKTPFYSAALKGHVNVARLLLDRGASIETPNRHGFTPLNAASASGHIEVVRLLLGRNASIETPNDDGRTPLNSAALEGRTNVVPILLEKGANIETYNRYESTPLNTASYEGYLDVVRLLLQEGANKETTNNEGMTPLYCAAIKSHTDVISILLEKGANIETSENSGWTPLNAVSYEGHLEVVNLLLQKGANKEMPNDNGVTPLYSAALKGHTDIVSALLEKGANIETPTSGGWTPLNIASESGHLEVVNLLLKSGANIETASEYGSTPLYCAVLRGHTDIVRLLLDRNASVEVTNSAGWTPLNVASEKGFTEIVRLLLDRNANMEASNDEDWTPLNAAIRNSHLEVVHLLLDRNANIETTNKNGWTPLNTASEQGLTEIVRLLLDRNANMETSNNEDWTPLSTAAIFGRLDVVRLLLDRKANRETIDSDGCTPLNNAATKGYLEVVRLLLNRGANLETADKNGYTALNSAVRKGHLEVVRLLLDRGPNLETAHNRGYTPLHTASYYGHPEIAELLVQRGASMAAIDGTGRLPLFCAVFRGHLEVVRVFGQFIEEACVASGKSKSQADDVLSHNDHQGRNIFYYIARSGNVKLLEHPFQDCLLPDTKDKFGRNILDYASMSGSAEMIEKILELYRRNGSPLASSSHWSALHWACRSGSLEAVETLTRAQSWRWMVGTNIPEVQWSPLDIAVYWNNPNLKADDEALLSILCSARNLDDRSLSSTDSVRLNSLDRGYKAFGGYCDGCYSSIVGWRFRCEVCPDFDYCFMCKQSSDLAHPEHSWEFIAPRTEDWP